MHSSSWCCCYCGSAPLLAEKCCCCVPARLGSELKQGLELSKNWPCLSMAGKCKHRSGINMKMKRCLRVRIFPNVQKPIASMRRTWTDVTAGVLASGPGLTFLLPELFRRTSQHMLLASIILPGRVKLTAEQPVPAFRVKRDTVVHEYHSHMNGRCMRGHS